MALTKIKKPGKYWGIPLNFMKITAIKTLRLITLPLLALSASISSLSAAPKPPVAPAPAPKPVVVVTDTVSGTVTAAGTSPAYGVPGANLTLLLPTSSVTTITSATGAYSFTGIPSSTKGITVDSIDNYYLNLSDAISLSPGTNTVNMLLYPKVAVATTSSILPTVTRLWSVTNPIPVPVTFTYSLSNNAAIKGSFTVAGLKTVSFSTPTQTTTNIVYIYVANVLVAVAGK